MSSLKWNILYSGILTVSNYIFPLLVFPYVSRVLGVANIGVCNFVDSILNYFILFASMGINSIGVREIAKWKNDRLMLNRTFTSLMLLNGGMTIVASLVLVGVIFYVPYFYEYKNLMFIGITKVVFTLFMIEWFFKGMEEFKYITSRTILIKFCYVLCVFVFVRHSSDYVVFFLLTALLIVFNGLFDIFCARRYVSLDFSKLSISQFCGPFMILGIYMFLTSMYTTFNTAFLGFVTDIREVGYYSVSTKIYTIVIGLFSAFTGVMLPRVSVLLSDNQEGRFNILIAKSFEVLLVFAFPTIILTEIYAPEIIRIIAGREYEAAILPMRIIMPLIFIIGLEQILVLQVLMPLKKDKLILINSIIGAAVGILLNFFLVRTYKSVGTAGVWLIAELSVLLLSYYFVKRNSPIKFDLSKIKIFISISLPIVMINIWLRNIIDVKMYGAVIGSFLTLIYFLLCFKYILKFEWFDSIVDPFIEKLKWLFIIRK